MKISKENKKHHQAIKPQKKSAVEKMQERHQRQAAALRENLKKRKHQAVDRSTMVSV